MDEYLVHNKSFLRLLEEYKKHGSLCIGVDYDGTLFDYHGKGSTYHMVKDLVKELHLLGCKIIIWTANKDLNQVEKHLTEIEFPYYGINIDGINLGWESRKPFFNALLDDRSGLQQVYAELKLLVEVVKNNLNVSLLNELYDRIKHGDDEHQKWLKDAIDEFIKDKKL